jgi:cellulose synthase/poly-beta-1,6-N-acetylglucosamine synthase-like glycosyltransferase
MLPHTLTSTITETAIALPFAALAVLSLNLFAMSAIRLWVGWRGRPNAAAPPAEADLPRVLIQLPVYNEPNVVARLLRAVAAIDWPRDRLRVQLLDDSTDGTAEVAKALVDRLRSHGIDIVHIHRADRSGYKAGALANGLSRDDSPFVAIFDADFIPFPDFLRRAVPPLADDQRLAFVQARWEHLNSTDNLLTMAQAMMIDAHFAVEQRARSGTSLVLPFNGTCGVWRRAAIEAAGGWSSDTLCEDLDLSIRARLAGWRAAFLDDVAVPGELPDTLAAWRAQQFRWTKGFVQVARKLLPRVWASPLPFAAKLALTLQTCQPLCYPLTCISLCATLAVLIDSEQNSYPLSLFGGGVAALGIGGSVLCLAIGAATLKRGGWGRFPFRFATILLLNAGLMLSNSRAVLEALIGSRSAFARTPKRGALGLASSLEKPGPSGAAELLSGCGLGVALAYEAGWLSPLFSLTISGLLVMGAGLARERWTAEARRIALWRAGQQTGDQPAE